MSAPTVVRATAAFLAAADARRLTYRGGVYFCNGISVPDPGHRLINALIWHGYLDRYGDELLPSGRHLPANPTDLPALDSAR
ncbi:hypothetical protein [Actinoplanes sp. URMC 104]|uniref:hypothetical protein n=1 Tax=Actinoplanes sp. URMC 104 TaxID=3423409 RepID=UPI003F1C8DF3